MKLSRVRKSLEELGYRHYNPIMSLCTPVSYTHLDVYKRQTPGRVMDHIRRETLKLSNVQWLVIDEADPVSYTHLDVYKRQCQWMMKNY